MHFILVHLKFFAKLQKDRQIGLMPHYQTFKQNEKGPTYFTKYAMLDSDFLIFSGSQKWVGKSLKTIFFAILYNLKKMKQQSEQQFFQEWELVEHENLPLFSTQPKQQFSDGLKNILEKTSDSCLLGSGQWRTNILISEDVIHSRGRALTLKHSTSFEENSMENHGKKLKQSFIYYLKALKKRDSHYFQNLQSTEANYASWDQIEQALFSFNTVQEQTKNFLVNFGKKNMEAQFLIRDIIKLIPKNYLSECLIVCGELFMAYKDLMIEKMDEDQLQVSICLNYFKISQSIKQSLTREEILPTNQEQEYLFEEMVQTWMQTVFLALNGVLENPYDRQTPFQDLEGYTTFETARKLVKID